MNRVGRPATVTPDAPPAPQAGPRRAVVGDRLWIIRHQVVTDGAVVGVISQTDLLNARSSDLIGAAWDRVKVHHLMTRPAVTVHLATTVQRAARLMLDGHYHRVVVVDEEGAPIGVLTATDLLRAILLDEDGG